MKNFIIAFRSLLKKGRSNTIKILSLGIGLAVSIVLIAKICFEYSYDNFYPDTERLYQIQVNFARDEVGGVFRAIPGGVAPGMKANIPGVEAATRYTPLGTEEIVFSTPDKKRYSAHFVVADSSLFDVLPRNILAGNAKEVLARPMYAMVSSKVAESIGASGEVVGQSFVLDSYPSIVITIGGVFEALPENAHNDYDVLISMPTIGSFMGDGSMNWLGNDRYLGYVKLLPGVSPESLTPAIRAMEEANIDVNELKRNGVSLQYFLSPLRELNITTEVQRLVVILASLAFILLFTAMMNYVLIVITTLIGRTREIAVHKCYGASGRNISSMILSETLLHLLLSVGIAALLILLFQNTIQSLVNVSVGGLFNASSIAVLVGVCLFVFFFTGVIPARIFARIPVAAAFRNFQQTRRTWKRALLCFQLIATSFLFALLLIVNLQYGRMTDDNPGYTYENLLYCNVAGTNNIERLKAIEELQRLPDVAAVASCDTKPIESRSGNNVIDPLTDLELFNYAEMYYVDDRYFPLMEIPLLDGEPFTYGRTVDETSVMISESFADRLRTMLGWTGSVVGKELIFTEHGRCTIVGVHKEIRLGSIASQDNRPAAHFYTSEPADNLMIELHRLSPEAIAKVTETLERTLPEKAIAVIPYSMEMENSYRDSRNFRDMVIIGGIICLIISLAGLIGYMNDETTRRRKEITIRKVNGATAGQIIRLLSREVFYMALPASVAGVLCARVTGAYWLQQFSEKIPLNPLIFIGGAAFVLLVIGTSVVVKVWSIARENPAKNIKSE